MSYRTLKYLTRPMLFAVERERREAGMRKRHDYPDFRKLPKLGRFVINRASPFEDDGIPHMRCFIMYPEGGLAWSMDILVERYRRLPRFSTENVHAFRM